MSGAEELKEIQESPGWIIGNLVTGYTCWSLNSGKQRIYLQVKVNGKWINKARAIPYKNPEICSDENYPWFAKYEWVVDEFGEIPDANTPRAMSIMVREFVPKVGKFKSFVGKPFVRSVYKNSSDQMRDFEDWLRKITLEGNASPNIGSSGGAKNSKLVGCYYNGIPLYGKVQIVDYLADFKVQIVDYLPDLKVQRVTVLPNSCGKWQFVNYLPDFKIQLVDYLPDVKVQFVDYLPGIR